MDAHCTVPRRSFLRFAETGPDTFRSRGRAGSLPFETAVPGHRRYAPEDFLAVELQDALIDRGMTRKSAAAAVLASGAPAQFLAELSLGNDVSGLYLAVWYEIEYGRSHFETNRRSGLMTSDELTKLGGAQTPPPQSRTWQRVIRDEAHDDRHPVEIGVEGVVSLSVVFHWRAAVQRARRAGLDLAPRSVIEAVE